MSTLQVSLFGKLCIRRDGNELENLDALKAQELFCYLLLDRKRTHSREAIASVLWSDATSAQSKKYLRKALWQLQMAIDPQTKCSPDCTLLVDADWIEVNPHADIQLDLDIVENTFSNLQGIQGQALTATQAESIRSVVQSYRGDLLENWYHDWCIQERERYQYMYLALLDKLTDYCETHGLYEEGVIYGTRILHFEPARELTHRCLMRLYYHSGDRTAALRQYQRCVEALLAELNVAPAEGTTKLYTQLQTDNVNLGFSVDSQSPLTTSASAPKSMLVLDQLASAQVLLLDTLRHVEEVLQTITRTLSETS